MRSLLTAGLADTVASSSSGTRANPTACAQSSASESSTSDIQTSSLLGDALSANAASSKMLSRTSGSMKALHAPSTSSLGSGSFTACAECLCSPCGLLVDDEPEPVSLLLLL